MCYLVTEYDMWAKKAMEHPDREQTTKYVTLGDCIGVHITCVNLCEIGILRIQYNLTLLIGYTMKC